MSDTFGGIANLMTSLRVQQLAAQIISNNITNSATPGYTRQTPVLTTMQPSSVYMSGMGMVQVGTGVQLSGIARVRDEFLDSQMRTELSGQGMQSAIWTATQELQAIFPELYSTPGEGFITNLTKMFSAFTGISLGTSTKADAVGYAKNFCTQINDAYRLLASIRSDFDAQVRGDIGKINTLLYRIATANAGVAAGGGSTGAAAISADQRDKALEELAKLIKVDVARMADGTFMVMAGNGRVLVEGGKVNEVVESVSSSSGRVGIGIRVSAGWMPPAPTPLAKALPTYNVKDITAEITSGELAGVVAARDQVVADEMLELDELANSLIYMVNLVHKAGYGGAGNNTTGISLLAGTGARDISVESAVLGNSDLIAASRIWGDATNTEQAAILGDIRNMTMNSIMQSWDFISAGPPTDAIDPSTPLNDATPPFPFNGRNGLNLGGSNALNWGGLAATGTLVVNGVSINWTNADTMDSIISAINAPVTGVKAVFDWSSQRISILSGNPMSIYDQSGNLAEMMKLSIRVSSLAPINDGMGPLDNAVSGMGIINASTLQYRTDPSSRGTVEVDGTTVNWDGSWDLNTVLGAMSVGGVSFGLDATQRIVAIGTNPTPTFANPAKSVNIIDRGGNLTMALNLEAQPTFANFSSTLLAQMSAQLEGARAQDSAADGMVAQISAQRDAIMKVNVDEEKAKLLEYARAYEASVKAMAVLDEMLNVLINKMASYGSSGSSSVMSA